MKLESKRIKVKIIWIPAHVEDERLKKSKHLRMNNITDKLTHDENAINTDWKLSLMKKEIKRKLEHQAWKEALVKYKRSSLFTGKAYEMSRLTVRKIREFEVPLGPSTLAGKSDLRSDLRNLKRSEFFAVTSFVAGQSYLRDYICKVHYNNKKRKKRR